MNGWWNFSLSNKQTNITEVDFFNFENFIDY